MKAAVMRANNAPLEIEDIQIDDPGPGEVLVKVAATGICHSDLTVPEGGLPIPPQPTGLCNLTLPEGEAAQIAQPETAILSPWLCFRAA